jgi:hypothetical protein
MAVITINILKTDLELQLQPLTPTDADVVGNRRRTLSNSPNISPKKKELLSIAFFHAMQDPRHQGQTEPLIVISQGDTLRWIVLDKTKTPQQGIRVEVHSFSPLSIIPSHLQPAGNIPVLFPDLNGTTDGNGVISSGQPAPDAVANDFGWHKFSASIGNLSLDPCIFVG